MNSLRTERLLLRNWEERDSALFHQFCTDEEIASQVQLVRTPHSSKVFMERLTVDNDARGFGCFATEVVATGTTIGLIGLHPGPIVSVPEESSLQIVWWLAPEHRGKYYATEGALAWLEFAFGTLELNEVVSFANCNDKRSIGVMERIGMRRDSERDLHQHQELVSSRSPRLAYRITLQDWGGPAERVKALTSRLLTCEMTLKAKEHDLSADGLHSLLQDEYLSENISRYFDALSLEIDLSQNIFEYEQDREIEKMQRIIESTRVL